MRVRSPLSMVVVAAILCLPVFSFAQSSDQDAVPLGDVARALRKSKAAPEQTQTVIDNDNLPKVMEQAESQKANSSVKFSFQSKADELRTSPPDVTCSLAFNAESASDLPDPLMAQDLPRAELVKLDGPAVINGDSLQVTVYNGTKWNVKEITVGLTILRRPTEAAGFYGTAQLRPAADVEVQGEKHADLTVLYHLRGLATPLSTATFSQSLGAHMSPDADWHWAIVQAQGIPPK